MKAWERGDDASETLTSWALQERARCNVGNDNITAVVVGWSGPGAAKQPPIAGGVEGEGGDEGLPPAKRRPLSPP